MVKKKKYKKMTKKKKEEEVEKEEEEEEEEEERNRKLVVVVVTVRWNHIHKSCESSTCREFHVAWIKPVTRLRTLPSLYCFTPA